MHAVGTLEGVIGSVRAGGGIAVLPRSYLNSVPGAHELSQIGLPEKFRSVEIFLVVQRWKLPIRLLDAFVQSCLMQSNHQKATRRVERKVRANCGRAKLCFLGIRRWRLRLVFLSSCAWRVVPPAKVAEPVPVYLSEYGRHTRLALPDDSTAFFEYGFGEWNFYGLEKQGWSPPYARYRDSEKAHCREGSFPTR